VDNAAAIAASTEEILLAALARILAITSATVYAAVDLAMPGGRFCGRRSTCAERSAGFSTIYPIALPCMDLPGASCGSAAREVSRTVKAVPHHGIGYGLLRYLARSDRRAAGGHGPARKSFVSYLGMIPEWQESDAAVQFDSDTELTVRQTCRVGSSARIAGRIGTAACSTWTGGMTAGGAQRHSEALAGAVPGHADRADR
jgi:phthiocerol/phenolphthiocerol synthesis type-I polyketide synthase E